MAERITAILVTVIGLSVLGIFIAAVVLVALAATGDVGEANGCLSDQANATGEREIRGVNTDSALSEAWQAKWREFDAKLDAGQSASVSFTESESTSRSTRYLDSKDAPIKDLVICFHDGDAEAIAKVGLPILADLPGIGDSLDTNVRVRGTVDFSGVNPRIVVSEIEAGNLPDKAAERLKGRIEGVINDRLDDLRLEHKYTPKFSEGAIEITGTP